MYLPYFGLTKRPFALQPDAGSVYMSPQHELAYMVLEHALHEQSAITVITGEIGAGKTTLIRRLLSELDDRIDVGLINFTHQAFGELPQWVAMALDVEFRGKASVELYNDLITHIIDRYAAGRRTLIIVDEAQYMSVETLEELRMLSNINADGDVPVQLMLCGQPELGHLLRLPQLRQFAQRVTASFHLKGLSQGETARYIQHRLTVSGARTQLFSGPAMLEIWRVSSGIPRIINILCDTSLLYCMTAGAEKVTLPTVSAVVEDRCSTGLLSRPPQASVLKRPALKTPSASAEEMRTKIRQMFPDVSK